MNSIGIGVTVKAIDEKYFVLDNDRKYRIGEITASMLNDDIKTAFNLSVDLRDAIKAYEVSLTDQLRIGSIPVDKNVKLGDVNRQNLDNCVLALESFAQGCERKELYDEIFGLLPIARQLQLPLSDKRRSDSQYLAELANLKPGELEFVLYFYRELQESIQIQNDLNTPIIDRVAGILSGNSWMGMKQIAIRELLDPNGISNRVQVNFSVSLVKGKPQIVSTYHVGGLAQMLMLDFVEMMRNNVHIKLCEHCKIRHFIPIRSDQLFCSTCKAAGASKKYVDSLKQYPYKKAIYEFQTRFYNKYIKRKPDSPKKIESKKVLNEYINKFNYIVSNVEKLESKEKEERISQLLNEIANASSKYLVKGDR